MYENNTHTHTRTRAHTHTHTPASLVMVTFTVAGPPSLNRSLVQVYTPASVKITERITRTLPLLPPYSTVKHYV